MIFRFSAVFSFNIVSMVDYCDIFPFPFDDCYQVTLS